MARKVHMYVLSQKITKDKLKYVTLKIGIKIFNKEDNQSVVSNKIGLRKH